MRLNGTFHDGNVEKCHWNGKRVDVLLKRECDAFSPPDSTLHHQFNTLSSSFFFLSPSFEWKCVTLKFSTRSFPFRSTIEMSLEIECNANTDKKNSIGRDLNLFCKLIRFHFKQNTYCVFPLSITMDSNYFESINLIKQQGNFSADFIVALVNGWVISTNQLFSCNCKFLRWLPFYFEFSLTFVSITKGMHTYCSWI